MVGIRDRHMVEYYKPSLPIGLKRQIMALFAKYPEVGDMYDYNPVTFIRDAIRERVVFYEKLYQHSSQSGQSVDS